jgi:hypothetical protein
MSLFQRLYTKSKKKKQIILRTVLILGLISLPFSFKKPPIKDWLIRHKLLNTKKLVMGNNFYYFNVNVLDS